MRNLFLITFFIGLFQINAIAQSYCHPIYKEKLANIEKIIISPRGSLISTSLTSVISQPALLAAGLFSPATAVVAGSVVISSGIAYVLLKKQIKSFQEVIGFYDHIDDTRTKTYRKIKKKLAKKNLLIEDFKTFFTYGMENGDFCQYDYKKDDYKPLKLKTIMKRFMRKDIDDNRIQRLKR